MKMSKMLFLYIAMVSGESAFAQDRSLHDFFFVTEIGENGKVVPTDLAAFARAIRGKDFSQHPTHSIRFNKDQRLGFATDVTLDHRSPVFGLIEKCEPDALAILANQKANLSEPFLVQKYAGVGYSRLIQSRGTVDENKNLIDGQLIQINQSNKKNLRSYGEISTFSKGKVVSTIHFELSWDKDQAARETQKLLNGEAIEAREVINRINPTLITALDYARFLRKHPYLQNRDQACMDKIISFLEEEKVPTGEELLESDPLYTHMKGGIEARRTVNLTLFGATPIFRGTSETAINESDRNILKEASDLIQHIEETSKVSDQ